MYEAFFGLKCKPFADLPDHDFLFETEQHAEGLRVLGRALADRRGTSLVTGDIGCGKTILVNAFLRQLDGQVSVCRIANAHPSLDGLSRWVLAGFNPTPAGTASKAVEQDLARFLAAADREGRTCLVVVDEAQNLSSAALEELLALSNPSAGGFPIHLVLAGESALRDRIADPASAVGIRDFAASIHLQALRFRETLAYVRQRLDSAGAAGGLFTDRAIAGVHCVSSGVPRIINLICDLALVYAFADGLDCIDLEVVERVAADRSASGFLWLSDGAAPVGRSLEVEIGGLLDQLLPPPPPASTPMEGQVLEIDLRQPDLDTMEVPEPSPDAMAFIEAIDASPLAIVETSIRIEAVIVVAEDPILPAAMLPSDDAIAGDPPMLTTVERVMADSPPQDAVSAPPDGTGSNLGTGSSDPNHWPSVLTGEGMGSLARFNTARPSSHSARVALRRRFLPRN